MTQSEHSASVDATLPGADETADPPSVVESVRARGTLVDRYVLIDVIGQGAMGVVYAAVDPDLDRKVALKLLRPGRGHHSHRSQRLREEAQALAQVSGPHVVSVYDVGAVGEEIYIAMEFVRGQTLDAWLRTKRRWPEILAVLVGAARGLAAAHSAGIVHGDFKPTNVMVDEHGVAHVLDFGLARRVQSTTTTADATPGSGPLPGTPAYMSPEHVERKNLTPQSDQFAFCVAAHEALLRVRPFAGDSPAQIAQSLLYERPAAPPRGHGVPAWVRRAIDRGLARDPAARWPSMSDLVAELTRDRARRRRVIFGLGAIAAAAAAWGWSQSSSDSARCVREVDTATADWGDARRASVRAVIERSNHAYGPAVATSVVDGIGRYVDDWRAQYVETCLASREILPDDTRRDTMACLQSRARALEATLTALVHADADVLDRGVTAIEQLPRVASCSDPAYVAATRPPPEDPAQAAALARVETRLAEADAAAAVGRYDAARDVLRATTELAEATGDPHTLARVHVALGRQLAGLGEHEPARDWLRRGYASAITNDTPRLALAAALTLVHVERHGIGDLRQANEWAFHAAALVERAHVSLEERAQFEQEMGTLAAAAMRSEDAVAHQRRALELRTRVAGEDSVLVAMSREALGVELRRQGRVEEARRLQEAALERLRAVFGDDHPRLTPSYNNLGRTLLSLGEVERGRQMLQHAVALTERSLPPGHVSLAYALTNLAIIERDAGDLPGALATCERALAIREAALPEHHPHIGYTLVDRADLLRRLGRYDQALADLQRAEQIARDSGGDDHPGLAESLTGLGRLRLDQGDPAGAIEPLERALALRERTASGHDDGVDAVTRFSLARALWDADGGERDRARILAEQATAQLQAEPAAREGVLADELAEMRAWHETH